MHSFEVHSNESACRKQVRLGLEQVNRSNAKSTRSTNSEQLALEMETFFFPKRGKKNSLFAAIYLSDTDTVNAYKYLNVSIPVISKMGMQHMLIVHAYDTYEMMVLPIKRRRDTDMLNAYDVLYNTL